MNFSSIFAIITFLFTPFFLLSEANQVVLVTGGAGYIGSHTCKALKDAGFIPVTYDSLSFGEKEAVKWGPLIVGDLLDKEALEHAFELYQPCAVLHFAALRNVGESVQDPSSYYTINVSGSLNLLNAILKYKVKHIIFSSSCTVYGNCNSRVSEETPQAPTNPYGRSKQIIEKMIIDYAYVTPLNYMILRYFNAAGIEVEANLKRSLYSSNFLIPRAMRTLTNLEGPLPIFGCDYDTQDGTCVRDYIHVKDLARAHVLALQHLLDGKSSNQLNLGTGKGYSVFQIVQAIEQETGRKISYEIKPRKEGDVPHAVAEIHKAKEVLQFEPLYSDLSTIIQSEWASLQRKTADDN